MGLSSWMKEEFFAIHLFGEQIFSMNEHLERIIAQFLKVNRFECCDEKQRKNYQHQHDHFKDWGLEKMASFMCSQQPKDRNHHPKKKEQCSKGDSEVTKKSNVW